MLISRAEKERISATIAKVEKKTSGEIFCVIARQCGDYRTVPLIWAAALALLLPLPMILFSPAPARWIYLGQLALFVIASLVLSIPSIRFYVVPRRLMHGQAHAEAMRQFCAQGLHKTEGRTGVLIFASEAEHYAEIIADAGINAKVTPVVWDDAVRVLIDGIGEGRAADGFIAAIDRCGVVLARHFPPGALNPNELPNRVIEI
jgi:putative membrane protein